MLILLCAYLYLHFINIIFLKKIITLSIENYLHVSLFPSIVGELNFVDLLDSTRNSNSFLHCEQMFE